MKRNDTPENAKQPEPNLWKNRNFRLVFSATAISNLGDGVAIVADVFRALLTLCVVALVFWTPSSGGILLLAAAFMLGGGGGI